MELKKDEEGSGIEKTQYDPYIDLPEEEVSEQKSEVNGELVLCGMEFPSKDKLIWKIGNGNGHYDYHNNIDSNGDRWGFSGKGLLTDGRSCNMVTPLNLTHLK